MRFAFTHDIRDDDGAADRRRAPVRVHDARRHDHGRHVLRGRRRASAGRARGAQSNPQLAAFIDECKRGSVMEADLATMEKKGMPTGLFVTHPLTGEQGRGLGRQLRADELRRRRGDGRARARRARLRVREEIRAADQAGDRAGRRAAEPPFSTDALAAVVRRTRRARRLHQLRQVRRPRLRRPRSMRSRADLAAKGLGEKKMTYRLRDWGISRQRYWGTPIPIIHCAACGDVPVPEEDLPVVLPEDCVPDGTGNPLDKRARFRRRRRARRCGGPARRETDTMDTFVDSSWYYMRYASPGAATMVDARNDYWMPMDQYIGGISARDPASAVRALLDQGDARLGHGRDRRAVHAAADAGHGARRTRTSGAATRAASTTSRRPTSISSRDEQGTITGAHARSRDGLPVEYGGIGTMSKSKLNGVDPQDMIDRYGADAARLFVMFAAPPEQHARMVGHRRRRRASLPEAPVGRTRSAARHALRRRARRVRLARCRRCGASGAPRAPSDAEAGGLRLRAHPVQHRRVRRHEDAERARGDARRRRRRADALVREGLSILLRVLYPVVPHMAWVLWNDLGFAARLGDLLDAPWPAVDDDALAQDEIELDAAGQRQAARQAVGAVHAPTRRRSKRPRAAAPEVASMATARPSRRSIVVPGTPRQCRRLKRSWPLRAPIASSRRERLRLRLP